VAWATHTRTARSIQAGRTESSPLSRTGPRRPNDGSPSALPREIAIYRALLTAILNRAYVRAYGHAARSLARLREIAATDVGLLPLESHEDFEAAIRSRHARKTAFWAHVSGSRSDRADEDERDSDA
jgi:hypothetical protein